MNIIGTLSPVSFLGFFLVMTGVAFPKFRDILFAIGSGLCALYLAVEAVFFAFDLL